MEGESVGWREKVEGGGRRCKVEGEGVGWREKVWGGGRRCRVEGEGVGWREKVEGGGRRCGMEESILFGVGGLTQYPMDFYPRLFTVRPYHT